MIRALAGRRSDRPAPNQAHVCPLKTPSLTMQKAGRRHASWGMRGGVKSARDGARCRRHPAGTLHVPAGRFFLCPGHDSRYTPLPRGANIDPVPSPRSGMCGEEEDDEIAPRPDFPLIKGHTCCRLGAHFDDVVTIVEAFGEKPRIGYFEDFDDKWGAAIIWMDGSRTWYPWDRWDEQKNPGWRFELAPPTCLSKRLTLPWHRKRRAVESCLVRP